MPLLGVVVPGSHQKGHWEQSVSITVSLMGRIRIAMRQRQLISAIMLVATLLTLLVVPTASAATLSATIDFEGLAEGTVVSTLTVGSGISGDPISGSVAVGGFLPSQSTNRAVIFDSTCTGGCTGGDNDLLNPSLGNTLIVHEGSVATSPVADPDDADVAGQYFTFDFSGFGPGTVTVTSLTHIDVGDDNGSGVTVDLYGPGGVFLQSVVIPPTNTDGGTVTGAINVSGVASMRVTLGDSGAIDNVQIEVDEPEVGTEGCTPGYWKNHTDTWASTGYAPGQTTGSVFSGASAFPSLASQTLLQTLQDGGGSGTLGSAKILLRAGTAALLNAAHPDVDYPRTTAEIIADVNAALASNNRDTMLAFATELDNDNNLGCPLN